MCFMKTKRSMPRVVGVLLIEALIRPFLCRVHNSFGHSKIQFSIGISFTYHLHSGVMANGCVSLPRQLAALEPGGNIALISNDSERGLSRKEKVVYCRFLSNTESETTCQLPIGRFANPQHLDLPFLVLLVREHLYDVGHERHDLEDCLCTPLGPLQLGAPEAAVLAEAAEVLSAWLAGVKLGRPL
jgi:hypothetical protein